MPHTNLRRVCCRLGLLAVGFFAVFLGLVAAGQRGGDTSLSDPWLAWTMLAAATAAIAGAAFGATAVIRESEQTPRVLATTAFGMLVLAFAVTEIVFPQSKARPALMPSAIG